MADYGRNVQFGLFPAPETAKLDEVLALARIADDEGLDLLGVQDHPYQSRFLDTWTLIAHLLARTERVRVFPDVASLPLRPPAVLAKAAVSLDVVSGGRFELGLGAGAWTRSSSAPRAIRSGSRRCSPPRSRRPCARRLPATGGSGAARQPDYHPAPAGRRRPRP
jgi:alkanesulfonate monooxygenase SsuD/methylene tetrahydromethanopterin reductase-like flavin-dependent oxidoreductase (luciferase family)